MPIDRVANTLLTELNPNQRRYVNDEPERAIGASGLDVARMGSKTIDRADPRGWNSKRPGLTPPVRGEDASEYGDEAYRGFILY
jgi:hypothetical protein